MKQLENASTASLYPSNIKYLPKWSSVNSVNCPSSEGMVPSKSLPSVECYCGRQLTKISPCNNYRMIPCTIGSLQYQILTETKLCQNSEFPNFRGDISVDVLKLCGWLWWGLIAKISPCNNYRMISFTIGPAISDTYRSKVLSKQSVCLFPREGFPTSR